MGSHVKNSTTLVDPQTIIDDLLIVWGSDVAAIPDFVFYLNNNCFNLLFSYWHDPNVISFLELSLRGEILTQCIVSPSYAYFLRYVPEAS